ncbi:hypothetical protein SMD11_4770 [Streptomyces albireticuli]|uniref:Uncharacterized protein n=1 Tax=Streptomyces albireticuli TaxID=1940 RepID=A0A1Z2L7V7_9ACTN|nr:hypothetical protein SMD11_4770 [Streptomyces albireticuli]
MLKYPKAPSSYARRSGPGRSAVARASRTEVPSPAQHRADSSRRPRGPAASGLSMSTTQTSGQRAHDVAAACSQEAERTSRSGSLPRNAASAARSR